MATNYRNYAENLIGNWNTDQYAPQRDVIKSTYNTNWDKLQNDFTIYMDRLNRNLDRARTNYHDTLANAAENSYARTNAALQDLSNKGLIGSGLAEKYAASDNANRGKEINAALEKIINTRTGYEGSLVDAVGSMAEKENKLNQNLAKGLGDLTGAEQGNAQNYANLVAGLAGSAETRELNNALVSARIALSGSGNATAKKEEEDERRLLILDTLSNSDMTDNEKVRNLTTYLDVPVDKAEAAVKAYSDNQAIEKAQQDLNKYTDKLNGLTAFTPFNQIKWSDVLGTSGSTTGLLHNALGYGLTELADRGNGTIYLTDLLYRNKIKNAEDKLNELTYTDLYNLLNSK